MITSGAGGAAIYPVSGDRVGKGKLLTDVGTKPEGAAFSPDGSLLAVSSQDGSLDVLRRTTLRRIGVSLPLTSTILANIQFSRDGRLLVVQDTAANHHFVDVRQRTRIGEPIPGYTAQTAALRPR